jgi:hypothetical protein
MKTPKVLGFRSRSENCCEDVPRVTLVERKEQRSKVEVKVDKAGEICAKTPKAVPRN